MTKNYAPLFLALLLLAACQQKGDQQALSAYEQEMNAYQDSVNRSFLSGSNQVLTREALALAKAVPFYPPDERFRVRARFIPIDGGDTFEMRTNTDRLPLYKDFGIFRFSLSGDSLELHVYQSLEHPDHFFLPFKDRTNGPETYGGGRYLDFTERDLRDPIIDFNKCYNPYCAYNPGYSCPIPPGENHLEVAIEAGVKKYK